MREEKEASLRYMASMLFGTCPVILEGTCKEMIGGEAWMAQTDYSRFRRLYIDSLAFDTRRITSVGRCSPGTS
jgi:hypothetical protein